MQPHPFTTTTTPAELVERVLTALRSGADDLAPGTFGGAATADRVTALTKTLGGHDVQPGELVAVSAGGPADTVVSCLAVWLAGGTPRVGPGPTDTRLEVTAESGVRVSPVEPRCLDAALVVTEPLVGCVAHPWSTLGRLELPTPAPTALQVLADWRVDAWLPLVVGAWLAGVGRLTLRTADAVPVPDPQAVLACPVGRLSAAPAATDPTGHAGWVTWGSGCPDDLPPADRHRHGFGDHFLIADTRPSGTAEERTHRGRVPGRHRVCNRAGRPLPDNAWGWLALAGRPPVVADDLDALVATASTAEERIWVTDYRARRRNDGTIEFDLRELDPLRIAGRRLAPGLLDRLLGEAGLGDAALVTRDPDTDRNRLVLCASDGSVSPGVLDRLVALLPGWAAPVATASVPTLPRDEQGTVDLARLVAAAPPDSWLLARAEQTLGETHGAPVRLHVRCAPAGAAPAPLPANFVASGGTYPGTRPAEAVGPEVPAPTDDLLVRLRRAADTGRGLLLVDADGNEQQLSYAELLDRAARIGSYLREQGLGAGDELILHSSRPDELFSGIWACIMTGVLAVPLIPAVPYEAAGNPLWHLLGPDTMLTRRVILTTQAQRDATLPALEQRGLTAQLLSLETAQACAPLPVESWSPSRHALLLLTSGSTGAPKGVALSHTNLVSLADAIGREFALDDDVSINWLAVDHVGGLVQHHMRDLCLANQQIHVNTSYVLAEPTRLLDLCDRHRVTITWMANFGFNMINEQAEKIARGSWDLSTIKVWENGGEAVTHEGNQRFLNLLAPHGLRPDVVKPVFGMTETSSAIIVAHNLIRGRQDNVHWLSDTGLDRPVARALPGDGSPFVEVGVPTAGVAMRVVDADGQVCPEGVAGRIEVRGHQIMDGYYRNDKANAETFTEDGWLRMGDCGFMVDGSLTVTGREKDVIIVNGLNYAARALENAVEAVPGVRSGCCAAVSVRSADAVTDDLVLFYSSTAGETADPQAIETALVDEFNLRPVAVVELDPEQWPRTIIGKIRRPPLAQAFLAGDLADRIRLRSGTGLGEALSLPAWHYVPRWRPTMAAPAPARRILWLGDGAAAPGALVAVPGASFAGFDEAGLAQYRPDDDGDLAALLAAASERHGGLDLVIDARRRTAPEGAADADTAVRALTTAHSEWDALCRAVADLTEPPAIIFATESAFAVTGAEPSIAHAALPGLAESLRQSYPQLAVKLVDGGPDDALLSEHTAGPGDTQVAYRDGVRLTPVLEPVAYDAVPAQPRRVLREGGVYLVIGGLGGVGAHLCQHLLRRFRARLLVVGRSSGDGGGPRAQTLAYLSDQAAAEPGAQLRYQALDAVDADALRAVVDAAERDWGTLDGVFNLAGEGSVVEQVDALMAAERVDDSHTRRRAADRIRLCHALDSVFAGRPTSVVTFSSVNGFFGGAGFADYAGACAYQAAHAAWTAHHTGRDTVCLDWSMWQQTGMAAGAPSALVELARRRGFDRLTPAQGLASMHLALDGTAGRMLIGLRAEGGAVAPLLPFDTFTAEVRADGVEDATEVAELLGLPPARVTCARTAVRTRSDISAQHTEAMLEVFRSVLGRPELTEDDGFFAVGGDSIRAIQVVTRAADRGIRFSALDLFEHKTVAALLAHLADGDQLTDVPLTDAGSEGTGPVAVPPIFAWWLEKADQPEVRNHLTMGMRYQVDSTITSQQLEEVLLALVERHDALRLRLVEQADGWRLTTVDEAAPNLRLEVREPSSDGRHVSPTQIESELHRGLDPHDGPLVRAAHLRSSGPSPAQLVVVVHHAAVDGVSWRIIEDDLRALLDAVERGGEAALPAPTLGYLAWARRVQQQAGQVDGQALADAWLDRMSVASGRLPGHVEQPPLERDTEVLHREFSAKALSQAADASINEVLLTAVGWSLTRWMGAEVLALDVEGHGRLQRSLPVDLSRSVGWFTAIAPMVLDLRGCAAAEAALPRVRRAVADLRGRDLEWGMLRYLDACPADHPLRELPERQVSYNYLGVFDGEGETDPLFDTVPGSLTAEQSPDSARHYLIDVAAQISCGKLELAVKYSPKIHSTDEIEGWLDDCERSLRSLLAGNTHSVIGDVDQDELLLALGEVDFTSE
ncbi:SDR family NAD(P)-dependent oxidoreductase [Micromonospora sp. CPCC 205546]|uniref:SDR family NAD(P)-dependent oxidoreductase n=1 Tax=Micromonospora sp. CPCC 205546 TaxID=3122397 RepID=UPI002FF4112C